MAEVIELCLFWQVVNMFFSDGKYVSFLYPDNETARKEWMRMKKEQFGNMECLKSDFQQFNAECVYPAKYITNIEHYAEDTYICTFVGGVLRRMIVFNSAESLKQNMAKIG